MKVKMLRNGEVKEYNDSYAMRLIEQGKAVIAPKEANKSEPLEPDKTTGRKAQKE